MNAFCVVTAAKELRVTREGDTDTKLAAIASALSGIVRGE
jgi:hypothetical protein